MLNSHMLVAAVGLVMFFSVDGQATQHLDEPPALNEPVSVQRAALDFLDFLRNGNMVDAPKYYVDFGAWTRISKRALDPEEHRFRHEGFVRAMMSKLRHGVNVDKLELKDVLVLKKGRKLKKNVVMAVFHLHLSLPDGREQKIKKYVMPLLFLHVQGAWRLMVRK